MYNDIRPYLQAKSEERYCLRVSLISRSFSFHDIKYTLFYENGDLFHRHSTFFIYFLEMSLKHFY